MRRRFLLPVVLLLLVAGGIAPTVAVAEEEEAAPPWFMELIRPAEANAKITAVVREAPRARQRFVRQAMATEYLDAWKGAGLEPEGDEVAVLYSMNLAALRYAEALGLALPQMQDETLEPKARAVAAGRVASIVRSYRMADALGDETEAEAATALAAVLPVLADVEHAAARGTIHSALAARASRQEDDEAVLRHWMLAAEATPSMAGSAARTIIRTLQGKAHSMEGYAPLREEAGKLLPVLRELAAKHLEAMKASGNERSTKSAESTVKRLETADRPLKMLGEKSNDWTLEHAFGDVKALGDLEGKVVVLDFWATWCPWCIKSFPAIRDLLRDYTDQGLVVVGVTASANAVYDQRYDLDEDLKDKMVEGQRPKAVARRARDGQKKEGDPPTLPDAEYREVEREALVTFIENHQMTWPVVMIDKEEPGPKFALTGWPHAVVIDRQGRVRYFKSGALLRDRPEAVAAFRKVLEDLLAEEAAPAAE